MLRSTGPTECQRRHRIRHPRHVSIRHHMTRIADQMEHGAWQFSLQTARLFGFDEPIIPSVHDPDRTVDKAGGGEPAIVLGRQDGDPRVTKVHRFTKCT